MLSNK
jgi:hypothetical protein